MTAQKSFPEGMAPIGNDGFSFSCHPGVPCFTTCCRKVDLVLYPYDVLRLKNGLGIRSDEFLQRYTRVVKGQNPCFPTLMLALTEEGKGACPFLAEEGCSVYEDRPSACRTYPLERAVDRSPERGRPEDYYFLVRHDYCKGHEETEQNSVAGWIRSQRLQRYNTYNDLYTEIDTLFAANPWQGEGAGGPSQQLAFMVCYNVDGFRVFLGEQKLLDHFRLSRQVRRDIATDDEELLKFGFEWLKFLFGGKSSLMRK